MHCFVFPINPNKIYVFLKTLPALEMLSLPSVQIWRLTITARALQVLTQCFLLLKHLANTNSIILVIPFWRKLMKLFIPWYRRGNRERDQREFKCLAWDLRSFYVLACWDATFMFLCLLTDQQTCFDLFKQQQMMGHKLYNIFFYLHNQLPFHWNSSVFLSLLHKFLSLLHKTNSTKISIYAYFITMESAMQIQIFQFLP